VIATVVAGFGLGSAFSGTVRMVLPLATAAERSGLLSTLYVESYLALSLPAVMAGLLAPVLGLPLSADIYGTVIILLAIASLIAARVSRFGAK
jgi:hypothetical protein